MYKFYLTVRDKGANAPIAYLSVKTDDVGLIIKSFLDNIPECVVEVGHCIRLDFQDYVFDGDDKFTDGL